jgi:hypothetical protein
MPENIVREAVRRRTVGGVDSVGGQREGGVVAGEDGEVGGGWVEDLNGLLGFNRGFQGRYVDGDTHEE